MSRRNGDKTRPYTGPDLDPLQHALGHRFNDSGLLIQALTHSSAARKRAHSNERLEFLGDRVLGLVVAGMLLESFPDEPEGRLGYRFSALVRRETLARVGTAIGLAPYLVLSAGEADGGGRENDGLIADCCEAVIAALYLDGGLDAAKAFIHGQWRVLLQEDLTPPKDAKTTLQEWAQGRGLPIPRYRVTGQGGPDHAPVFTVEVTLPDMAPESASGPSKQVAEQAAAEAILSRIASRQ